MNNVNGVFELKTDPDDADRNEVRERLREYNRQYWELTEDRDFVLRYAVDDALRAGAVFSVFGTWLEIEYLWVDESFRGQGLGTQLLKAVEDVGRQANCRKVFLTTLSFQARPFYEKNGYRLVYTQEHYPLRSERFFLEKDLSDRREAAEDGAV
jgi:GNAT superfamily N-acetyltransferase